MRIRLYTDVVPKVKKTVYAR